MMSKEINFSTVKSDMIQSPLSNWLYLTIPVSIVMLILLACNVGRVYLHKRQVKLARNQYFRVSGCYSFVRIQVTFRNRILYCDAERVLLILLFLLITFLFRINLVSVFVLHCSWITLKRARL